MNPKNILLTILSISFLLIAGGIFYYFVIVLPQIRREEIELQKQAFENEQTEKEELENNLNNCLIEAENQKKEDARVLSNSLDQVGCTDPSGKILETLGCMEAFSQEWDEIETDYSEEENACYSRYNSQ